VYRASLVPVSELGEHVAEVLQIPSSQLDEFATVRRPPAWLQKELEPTRLEGLRPVVEAYRHR
jgi:hypothetical protein